MTSFPSPSRGLPALSGTQAPFSAASRFPSVFASLPYSCRHLFRLSVLGEFLLPGRKGAVHSFSGRNQLAGKKVLPYIVLVEQVADNQRKSRGVVDCLYKAFLWGHDASFSSGYRSGCSAACMNSEKSAIIVRQCS